MTEQQLVSLDTFSYSFQVKPLDTDEHIQELLSLQGLNHFHTFFRALVLKESLEIRRSTSPPSLNPETKIRIVRK